MRAKPHKKPISPNTITLYQMTRRDNWIGVAQEVEDTIVNTMKETKMKRQISVLIAILVISAVAFAHGGEQHVLGTVTEVSEKSITVETMDKHKVTVSVVAETKFTAGTAAATLKDMKVGDRVVINARNQDQHLQADTVSIGPSAITSPKPKADPSEQPMSGMKMSKPKPTANSSDPSMPGMEMSKQKPTANSSDPSMPGMEMGQQKLTTNPSEPAMPEAQMNSYFTAFNYPIPKDTMMVTLLPDFQTARTGPNFFTMMKMAEYGITSRWSAGFMAEEQKIFGLPATFGGLRLNTYFHLFPHDQLLNLTLYGEYEYLNGAALYKMEVAGFGGEDLEGPLSAARNLPVHTFEQRAIVYHDWRRVNVTFNFISETGLESHENDFGYAWGIFRQPEWMGMTTDKNMAGMPAMAGTPAPPMLSMRRLGLGLEMMGALGNQHQFGFYWNREQHYLGPVFSYSPLPHFTIRLEPAFGLSDVSDPFVLRMGFEYSEDHFLHRLARAF